MAPALAVALPACMLYHNYLLTYRKLSAIVTITRSLVYQISVMPLSFRLGVMQTDLSIRARDKSDLDGRNAISALRLPSGMSLHRPDSVDDGEQGVIETYRTSLIGPTDSCKDAPGSILRTR